MLSRSSTIRVVNKHVRFRKIGHRHLSRLVLYMTPFLVKVRQALKNRRMIIICIFHFLKLLSFVVRQEPHELRVNRDGPTYCIKKRDVTTYVCVNIFRIQFDGQTGITKFCNYNKRNNGKIIRLQFYEMLL